MDEIEMNEIRTESETRENLEINAANRSSVSRRYDETSLKTVIKNQLLRFWDTILENSVKLLRFFILILSISEGLYVGFNIDDSLNSKFVRLVGNGLIVFMQCAFRCPGYKRERDEETGGERDEETGGERDEETGGERDEETGGERDEETGGERDEETGGERDEETGGERDEETDEETGGERDEETGGERDEETGGERDEETGGERDEETGGERDEETGGERDEETGGERDEETGGERGVELAYLFAQRLAKLSGNDFYLLVAKTNLSLIANILDILQGVSNDLMKNEMVCIAFSFVQCVAISVNVGTVDYRKIDETKYNLRRGEVFCNYPEEIKVPRERRIEIDKTKIEGNNFTVSQKFPNVPQNEKNRGAISQQFPSAFQNEENQAIGGTISQQFPSASQNEENQAIGGAISQQFPSASQNEENQAIGGAISQQFPSASQNEENQAIGGTISQQIPSVFQKEENQAISLPFKYVSQNNGDSDGDDIPMTTSRTTVHVHAVEEKSPTRIQEGSGINLSLQEAKNSPSRSSLDSNQVTLGPYICSTYNLPKPEEIENKKFAGTEESRSIGTIASPNTGARSEGVTGKFSVSKVNEDNILISTNEPNNTSQPNCRTLTSLEADSQPSSLDSNQATLEPLIDSTNNLSRSGVRDAQPSTSFDSENDTQEHLTDSPSNQPRKSKKAKKKLSYRVPLEAHLPTLFDNDPNLEKIILDLRARPSEISSVKTIKIFKCSRRRTVHIVSSFETKEKIVYNI
ncbi:hypothetical protein Anas_09689 [Armadillidium nasatum]|uniref:Uncharacterized protein n=1 Tax=Armadillidium nasatum TaxID=96803 RepID=A0A5N5T028_9CRUS|nr:hypothetical protein Anas_09689 [Armadillidium nasatum]